MKKILITDYVHPKLIVELEKRDYVVDYIQDMTMEQLEKEIHNYHGIVINSKIKMYKPMIDLGKQLRFICRLGSGLEIIDLEYAEEKNIAVINTPAGNSNAVSEHAVGMLLAFANNLMQSNHEVRNFTWQREKNRGYELQGKTIGIIGMGHTGKDLARKLKNWNMRILGHDKYFPYFGDEFSYVESVEKSYMQHHADIISFHLPLTEETIGYVDDEFVGGCKDDVVYVNTSRGKVIKTDSLIGGLKSGKIKGACLDVFENEKVETYSSDEKKMYEKLFSYQNVIVSPHVAGWTSESLERITDILLVKLKNID